MGMLQDAPGVGRNTIVKHGLEDIPKVFGGGS